MFKSEKIKKIMTWETIALFGIVVFIWVDEIYDLPHILLGAPASGINIGESVMETALIAVFGILLIFATAAKVEVERVRKKIDAIVKAMPDGLIVCDMNRRVIRLNKAASELLRISSSQKDQCDFGKLPYHIKEQIASALHEEPVSSRTFEIPSDAESSTRILESQTSLAYGTDGEKIGVISLIRDVTQKYELERMKDEFISTAAHELRTPLTAIRGFTEILLSDNPLNREQQHEFKQMVLNNAINLEKIISDLLDLSRVNSGKIIVLKKEPCNFSEMISDLVNTYKNLYPDNSFEIQLPDGMVTIPLDREKIEQVFHNLVSNAVKYSSAGTKIRISCERNIEGILVTVVDNGIGMKPDEVERVFDKFYRADASNTALPGLGLGMAIVKNIVEGHGGEINVRSKLKEGTSVSFFLPNLSSS